MSLNKNVISQFAKTVKDTKQTTKKETFVRGMVVKVENGSDTQYYVKIDGSNTLTPVLFGNNVDVSQPVTVMIKNHTATVMGNVSVNEGVESEIINNTVTLSLSTMSDDDIDALWGDYFN